MSTEWASITVRVHFRVAEIIVPPQIGAEPWIILVRREDKRSAASPTPHELGGYQFLLVGCFAVLPKEIAKCRNVFFHP